MKTVSGEIVSSTPVSISRAASILNKFVSTETGASQAVGAYLRRAAAAFEDLVRVHSKSDRRRHKKHKSAASASTTTPATEEKPTPSVEVSQAELTRNRFVSKKEEVEFGINGVIEDRSVNEATEERSLGEGNGGEDGEIKKKKKEKKTRVNFDDSLGDMSKSVTEIRRENSSHGQDDNAEETEGKKQKKKKKREKDGVGNILENGGVIGETKDVGRVGIKKEMEKIVSSRKCEANGVKEDKEEIRTKRKNPEVASEERQSKKKKRRKTGEGND